MTTNKEEQCCGNCCWMFGEDIFGNGMCTKIFAKLVNCADSCHEGHFLCREQMRHYLAVLIQHNRWRRDDNVPNSRKPVNSTELGKAIDFAIDYIKTMKEK